MAILLAVSKIFYVVHGWDCLKWLCINFNKLGKKFNSTLSPGFHKCYLLGRSHDFKKVSWITNHERNIKQNYNEVSPHTGQNGHQ